MKSAPDVAFYEPRIPGNTGNMLRLSACVGLKLHLIEPLGFEMSDAKLRRAGLDYRDLSSYVVHPNFDAFISSFPEKTSIYAFTGRGEIQYDDIEYAVDDVLLFGPEPTGLPDEILNHPRIAGRVRIPMQSGVRSLNLAVSASIAVYESWRQLGFATTTSSTSTGKC
jgi:tRNA (cytidine/uridine-2'-O-)-methyltransferase